MLIKTSELIDSALDYAVAKSEGKETCWGRSKMKPYEFYKGYSYSSDWSQGGAIIERERLQLTTDKEWVASTPKAVEIGGYRKYCFATGSTPLVAAMRCYVASKLGDTVEIPDELLDLK